jgi:hypothetical protein
VVYHHKPHVQTLVVSHYPASAPVHNFVLLFLPPCGPHLTPLATRSLKPSLLVSPLLGGPARHRPFALALPAPMQIKPQPALMQIKPQPAPAILNQESDTQPRVSPHHVVNYSSQPGATIHRSSDAPVLNLPLDECIDNTHK